MPAPPFGVEPWRLIPWSIPAAALVALILFGLHRRIGHVAIRKPSYIEVSLIPPSAALPFTPGPRAARVPQIPAAENVKRHPKPVRANPRRRTHRLKPTPSRRSVAALTSRARTPANSTRSEPSTALVPSGTASKPAASSGIAGTPGNLGATSAGAQALYAPIPKIPADLRANPLNTVAIARFTIASDGTATVILVARCPIIPLTAR